MSDFEDDDDWQPPTEAELKVIGKNGAAAAE